MAAVGKKAGAEKRGTRPPQFSPHSEPPLTNPSAAGAREGTQRAGPKGSTWLGRAGKRRMGSCAGGQAGKGVGVWRSGRASHPAMPPHPRLSPPPSSGWVATALRGPLPRQRLAAAASCAPPAPGARLRVARPAPDGGRPSVAPPNAPPLAMRGGEQARRPG